jgi:hypothetical protein
LSVRIIHQTWNTASVPENVFPKAWINSWIKHNSGWQYRLWTDEINRHFVKKFYPQLLSLFDSYDQPIKRSDTIRYCILDRVGGLYVDLDCICYAPIDDQIEGKDILLGIEPKKHWNDVLKGKPFLSNAFMYSKPGHSFWKYVFDEMLRHRFKNQCPVDETGPLLITRAYEKYLSDGNKAVDFLSFEQFPWADKLSNNLADPMRMKFVDGIKLSTKTKVIHVSVSTWSPDFKIEKFSRIGVPQIPSVRKLPVQKTTEQALRQVVEGIQLLLDASKLDYDILLKRRVPTNTTIAKGKNMRVGFTIIFNGLHHLKHNDYIDRIAGMFDLFVFVEGASGNKGSTSWCKPIPDKYHKNWRSNDGTVEFLQDFCASHQNVVLANNFVSHDGPWESKDLMCNVALRVIKSKIPDVNGSFLWEIDADEQWTPEQLDAAEKELVQHGGDCGMFWCDYFVGPGLVARGVWGEGKNSEYRRLWKWKGQEFQSHEPPLLQGGNGKIALLSPRFQHYAYFYPQDVQFKESFYTGHENIFAMWSALQGCTEWPQPLSKLVSGPWGKTATLIHKTSD